MRVRELSAADPASLAGIAAIEAEVFGSDAWSPDQVRDEVQGPGRRTWVAEDDEALVGYAVTWRSGDTADLQRIAVAGSHRGRGVARTLLAAGVEAARDDGVERVLLEVGDRNDAALGLYTGAGFVEIARRRRYYRDGSDAVVMERPLVAAVHGEDDARG